MPDTVGIANGVIMKMSDAALAVYTAFGQLMKIGDLEFSSPQVDATRLSQLTREYVSGVSDTPEINMEYRLLMDDATQDELTGVHFVFLNKQTRRFRIIIPGQAKGIQFDAVPISHSHAGFETNALLMRKAGFKLSGALTIAASAGW